MKGLDQHLNFGHESVTGHFFLGLECIPKREKVSLLHPESTGSFLRENTR